MSKRSQQLQGGGSPPPPINAKLHLNLQLELPMGKNPGASLSHPVNPNANYPSEISATVNNSWINACHPLGNSQVTDVTFSLHFRRWVTSPPLNPSHPLERPLSIVLYLWILVATTMRAALATSFN